MNCNFLYQITAASRTPDYGLPPPDPRSVCPLSSTEFVEPPRTKFLGTPLILSADQQTPQSS